MSKFLNKIVILFKQYDVSKHYMDASEAHLTNIVSFQTI